MWGVRKEQSLLAQKRNDVCLFQNFRYCFKQGSGRVYLICSVESVRPFWLGCRDPHPFPFHT